jgi:hypothetical protein
MCMYFMKPLLTTLVLSFLILPLFTYAQYQKPEVGPDGTISEGLVPCEGALCSTCDVVVLANTGIKWLLTLSFLFFAVLAVRAGVNLILAQGKPGALQDARQSFTNAFIGLIIILVAWILVDTLLRNLLGKDGVLSGGVIENYGPWSKVKCVEQVTPLKAVANYFGGDPAYLQELATANGGSIPPVTGAGGACSATLIGKYFPTEIGNAQCIITKESSCGATLSSVTDKMRVDGRPFSFGPMQINITVHSLSGCTPDGKILNCPAAFVGKNYSARVKDEALYAQCTAAAKNFDCNLKNGKIIKDRRGSWADWSTAGACGLLK